MFAHLAEIKNQNHRISVQFNDLANSWNISESEIQNHSTATQLYKSLKEESYFHSYLNTLLAQKLRCDAQMDGDGHPELNHTIAGTELLCCDMPPLVLIPPAGRSTMVHRHSQTNMH